MRSGDWHFFRMSGLEILESHPDLFFVAHFYFERVEAARTRAFRIGDFPIDRETAIVAGAVIISFVGAKIDEATGVRTNHVQGFGGFLAGSAQVNGADRSI